LKYFFDAELRRFLNKKAEPETLFLQYAIEQRATFNQVARAIFGY